MYLIPKNIKKKREIFKGFGILELLAMAISFGIGFMCQLFVTRFRYKFMLFSFFPILTFIMLIPLPNGSTPLIIFIKFLKYQKKQKVFFFK